MKIKINLNKENLILLMLVLLGIIWVLVSFSMNSKFYSIAIIMQGILLCLLLAILVRNKVFKNFIIKIYDFEKYKRNWIKFKGYASNLIGEKIKAKNYQIVKNKPCYILMNHSGNESNSILTKSDLRFLPNAEVDGINNEKLIRENLIISDKAVFFKLLDNQNLYKEYNAYFYKALNMLKKVNSNRYPVNGIVLNIDVDEILSGLSKETTEKFAQLDVIMGVIDKKYKLATPIYLVITGCHSLNGFSHFFADLLKEDAEQVWGIPFLKQEKFEITEIINSFDIEFDKLIKRLNERLLARLDIERSLNARLLISYFPQQMQLLKQPLIRFIEKYNLLNLRGIYFTSDNQAKAINDNLMNELDAHFQIKDEGFAASDQPTRSYFVKNLFSNAILPEKDWIYQTAYWRKNSESAYQLTCRLAIGIICVTALGLWISFINNKNSLATVNIKLSSYQQIIHELDELKFNLINSLPALTQLKAAQSIYTQHPFDSLLYLEIYQPLKIRAKLDQVWQHALTVLFLPTIADLLEKVLKSQQDPEVLYETLKGYLALDSSSGAPRAWLIPAVNHALRTYYNDQPEINRKIQNYLSDAIADSTPTLKLDTQLINQIKTRLNAIPPAYFAYYELKQRANLSSSSFDLIDNLGSDFFKVFKITNSEDFNLPQFYTLTGYENLKAGETKDPIQETAKAYEILGLDTPAGFQLLPKEMTLSLWALYNKDYINSWKKLLASVKIAPFHDLTTAIQNLNILIGVNSPMLGILKLVRENTALVHSNYLDISTHYAALNAILGLPVKSSPAYSAMIKNLSALHDYLVMLSNASNTSQLEFQDASAILQHKLPNNPIVILQRQAETLPEPLSNWIMQIADNSFNLLLKGAHATINSAWQNTVLPYYQQNIQGRYPLEPNAKTFIDLQKFSTFFGNNGIIQEFIQNYLSPFIDTSHLPWRAYRVGDSSLQLANNSYQQLQMAMLIHAMYFQNNKQSPFVEFSIQPRYLDPKSSSITLQLADQNLTYRHGPPEVFTWNWPDENNLQQAAFSFNDFQGRNFSETLNGPWAWFQLLHLGQLEIVNSDHYIWTINQSNHQASFDIWVPNSLPIFNLEIFKDLNLPAII